MPVKRHAFMKAVRLRDKVALKRKPIPPKRHPKSPHRFDIRKYYTQDIKDISNLTGISREVLAIICLQRKCSATDAARFFREADKRIHRIYGIEINIYPNGDRIRF